MRKRRMNSSGREPHDLLPCVAIDAVILVLERDAGAVAGKQAAVGDGDAVGIARQIGQLRQDTPAPLPHSHDDTHQPARGALPRERFSSLAQSCSVGCAQILPEMVEKPTYR
jgi:hypothetical protein